MDLERAAHTLLDNLEQAAHDGDGDSYHRFAHPMYIEVNGDTGEVLDLVTALVRTRVAFNGGGHRLRFTSRIVEEGGATLRVSAGWSHVIPGNESPFLGTMEMLVLVTETGLSILNSVFRSRVDDER